MTLSGVSAGHYTAFAKHVVTGQWYYFNDSSVTPQEPVPTDDRAYILFYDKIDPNHGENNTRRLGLINQTTEGNSRQGDGTIKLTDPPKKSDNCLKFVSRTHDEEEVGLSLVN